MSASDGFTYIGERFTQNFPDFIEKYNFFDMLQASLHPFDSWQEYWAFESRFVKLNYLDQPIPSYVALKRCLNTRIIILLRPMQIMPLVADYDLNKVFLYKENTFFGNVANTVMHKHIVMMMPFAKW